MCIEADGTYGHFKRRDVERDTKLMEYPIIKSILRIDGTIYPPPAFAETDATSGIWKPITEPSVTYGSKGYFIFLINPTYELVGITSWLENY